MTKRPKRRNNQNKQKKQRKRKPKNTATAFDGSSRVLRSVSDSALILIFLPTMPAYYARWFKIRVSRTEMPVLCSWKNSDIVERKYLVLFTEDITVVQISRLSDDFINNATELFHPINNWRFYAIHNRNIDIITPLFVIIKSWLYFIWSEKIKIQETWRYLTQFITLRNFYFYNILKWKGLLIFQVIPPIILR